MMRRLLEDARCEPKRQVCILIVKGRRKIIDDIRHAAEHVPEVRKILGVRARWLGHRLVTELDITVAGDTTVAGAGEVANALEQALISRLPALKAAHIHIEP